MRRDWLTLQLLTIRGALGGFRTSSKERLCESNEEVTRLSEARLPLGSACSLVSRGQLLYLCKAAGPSLHHRWLCLLHRCRLPSQVILLSLPPKLSHLQARG